MPSADVTPERAQSPGGAPASAVALVRGEPHPWEPLSIGAVLERVADWQPDKVAFVHDGHTLTFGQLLDGAGGLARGLLARGLEPGEPVALLMDNSIDWLTAFFATTLAGAAAVPINTRFVADEVAFILRHSRTRWLLAGNRFGRTTLEELLAKTGVTAGERRDGLERLERVIVFGADDPPPPAVAATDIVQPHETPVRLGQPASIGIIQYTSGTTGFPKGVMLCHDQILRSAFMVGTRLGLRSTDVMYSPMPFCHVGGAVLSVLFTLLRGATLVFPRRFDAAAMLRDIDAYRCTVTAGVETMLLALMDHPSAQQFSGMTLRAAWGAGPDRIFDFLSGFVNIYGLSENSPNAAMPFWDDPVEQRRDTCGFVQPGIELGIADPDRFENAWQQRGVQGEIRIRGWSVMQGYVNDPEATVRAISADGWLHTGDLGSLDDAGRIRFHGRIKETVRTGGEIVAAREIEHVLEEHPAVRAAYVVGIPDERLGEVPIALIQTTAGQWDDELAENIGTLAAQRLARFKVPRHLRHTQDPPVTESGKVQKRILLEQFLAEDGGDGGWGPA